MQPLGWPHTSPSPGARHVVKDFSSLIFPKITSPFSYFCLRYKFTVKIRALVGPVLEIYRVIDCVHHSLCGSLLLDPVTRLHAVGGNRPI